jgi:hypothetical protein
MEVQALFDQMFVELTEMGEAGADRYGWFPGTDMGLTLRVVVSLVTALVAYEPWYLPPDDGRRDELMLDHIARLLLYGLRLGEPPVGAPPQADPQ